MRLDKFLSNMGAGSRRDVHKLIASGKVKVDGSVCRNYDTHIDENRQKISVGDFEIPYKPFVYIMVNKPAGYLSSTEDGSGPVVIDLLNGTYASYKLGVAGRLDKDAEGLLLLTNDGQFIHRVISPDKDVVKTYFVTIKREITPDDVVQFKNGIRLRDGTQYKPAELTNAAGPVPETAGSDSHAALVRISEGKFHQVKKMFLATGNEVLYLKRLSIGGLKLDKKLDPGKFRELTIEEAEKVYEQANS